jgi:hypothetical protein
LGCLRNSTISELLFGLVHAGHVGEPHLDFIVGVDLRAAAREGHDAAFRAAHAPEEEAPQPDEEQQRNDPAEEIGKPAVGELAGVLDAAGLELFGQLRILDARDRELPLLLGAVLERAPDQLIADRDLGDLAAFDQRFELRVGQCPTGRHQVVHLRQAKDQQQRKAVPQRRRRPGADWALAASIAAPWVERDLPLVSHTQWAGRRDRREGQDGRTPSHPLSLSCPSALLPFVTHSPLPLLERKSVAAHVDDDRVAFEEVAFEDEARADQDPPLNRSLERTSAIRWIIPLADQILLGGVRQLDVDLPLLEPPDQPGELNVDDPLRMLAVERGRR